MTELKKTKEYDIFTLREDNRERITQSHVERLIESIKARNLLELRPISVNAQMEIIDGQHRYLAAKQLGVDIYYNLSHELTPADIITMNIAKAWGQSDYLNYFCKNNYPEYIKLNSFMKKNGITLKVALNITMGHKKDDFYKFKTGDYKFNQEAFNEEIDICWETIDYLRKVNGYSNYTNSSRFWSALLTLIRHSRFDSAKWRENLKRMTERFTAKASREDYLRMLMDVHNWRNSNKVELIDYVKSN